MIISTSNLYIVVTYISYSGISGDTDSLFTDRKEAEDQAEKSRASSSTFPGASLKYTVMTLDDYISEVRSEARQQGQQDFRDNY